MDNKRELKFTDSNKEDSVRIICLKNMRSICRESDPLKILLFYLRGKTLWKRLKLVY